VATNVSASTNPATPGLAHQRQERAASLCRDCYAGPLTIRDRGRSYLPQFPRETDDDYSARLATSVYYDAFGRTVDGLTGLVFRKPPQLATELPELVRQWWEDIDLQGTHGRVFCKARFADGAVDGHFLIFVDMQRADPARASNRAGVRTRRDEMDDRLRPYWIGIRKQDVLGFRTGLVDGRRMLTHLRFRTAGTEAVGDFGEREVERIRVYDLLAAGEEARRVAYRVFIRRGENWEEEEAGEMAIDEIPLATGYLGEQVGALESEPPHLAIALESLKHYQLVSDNDNVLHMAFPLLAIIGAEEDDDEQKHSPRTGYHLPAGGDMKYVEPQGHTLEAAAKRIAKSEERMAILGLSTLMRETRAPETATSKRIDKAESDSALAGQADAAQDAFEEALRLTAKWAALELPEKGDNRWIQLNRDFENLPLDPQTGRLLSDMVAQGQLTLDTMWAALVAGEVLPDTFSPDRERTLLDGGGLTMGRAVEIGAGEGRRENQR
jgi:hypothetical protein